MTVMALPNATQAAKSVGGPIGSPPDPQRVRIAQAARDFEAMALGQLLQPMFETVDLSRSLFGGGTAEAAWRPMLVNEISKQVTRQGGLGLAEPVFAQLLRMQETTPNGKETP